MIETAGIQVEDVIELLKSELVPALGCTEPIAVSLAVAKARETLGELPDKAEVLVSPNILKNGMGVGVPGTGLTGLPIAAALGAVYGQSAYCLELLKGVTPEAIIEAKKFLTNGKVSIDVVRNEHKLYIEASCYNKHGRQAKAVITTRHSNISKVSLDNKTVECNTTDTGRTAMAKTPSPELTISEIFDFAMDVPLEKISFILESAEMNTRVAREGLENDYGLMVSKSIKRQIERGILSDDLVNNAMMLTSAACDARMAGCTLPVMSNSGSGNQGLTATLPIVAAAEKLHSDRERKIRALVLSHLIAIHIKKYLGRLSALCGCVVSSAAAGCGICYLLGGGKQEIVYTIKNMVGSVTGMICDGAKGGCTLKVSSGIASAIQSALIALDGIVISSNDGIIEDDVEKTIQNLGKVGVTGMSQTDELLLQIMASKVKSTGW